MLNNENDYKVGNIIADDMVTSTQIENLKIKNVKFHFNNTDENIENNTKSKINDNDTKESKILTTESIQMIDFYESTLQSEATKKSRKKLKARSKKKIFEIFGVAVPINNQKNNKILNRDNNNTLKNKNKYDILPHLSDNKIQKNIIKLLNDSFNNNQDSNHLSHNDHYHDNNGSTYNNLNNNEKNLINNKNENNIIANKITKYQDDNNRTNEQQYFTIKNFDEKKKASYFY